ncbi:unnamed protein product [Symbiodinium natans]|uniref:Uncharacterized protein n=1 Tax=Symbiodinium natans TaxID=878477 RepID=A0A812VHX9_9DINO|nr:unnamed protein product [Symbiodinium natans]
MAWRLLLWLPLPVLSQPPIANEPCFQPSRPACEPVLDPQVLLQNSSGLCPERVWPQNYWNSYWSNYSVTKPPHCQIPLEVRVGLTMSLSGPRSDPEAAATLLQMLVDQSYVHQDYCISFCVLDDESSPQRAAQLYRSFVGEAGAAHKVDILLGPATYDFRSTAAQVAQEFQEPLLLWSTMPALGRTVLSTTDMTTAQALAEVRELRNLRRAGGLPEVVPPECGELCQVLQSSPFSDVDTCALLTPPAGRALRPLAKFLSCDGPCDPTADLDYCTRAASNLSVQGTWEPWWALPYGGWLDGCLVGRHWATANSATSVRLTLHFEESPTMTRIFAAGNGTLTHGNFTIEGRTISEGMWENQLLDGMELVFEYPSGTENDILWSICLAETCANFVCNASYFTNPAAYCWGATCDPQADHGRCCTQQEADLTTFLGQDVFSTTFDLSVPPSLWMQDLLPRIFDDDAQHFVCVAQNDARGLFTDLCRFYLDDALSHGFRTLAAGPLTLSVDNAVADMLARLQHMHPSPQVVLLCADLSIYTSFINAMITMQAAFHWVISAFPFDRELLSVVPAYTLFHNVLQSAPWPTMTYLKEHAQERSVCGSNHGKEELLQDGIWVQELYLASAGQLLDSVICSSFERTRGLFHVVEQEAPTADLPQIDSKVFFLYYLRYGPDPDGPKGGFITSLGQVSFGERGSRIQIGRGDVSSWRHETLPAFGALSETMSARDSWLYSQARYSISAVRSIETVLSPQLWPLGRKVLGTYPCPIGCRATNAYSCTACPPGYYRPLGETGCVPCTQLASDVFQDSWAGAMCFKCPLGAYCDPSRPAQEPVALPGYYRVENSSYMASFGKWSVEAACSSNSGLADLHANEMSSWLEAKKNHRWLFQRCLPVSACLGNNLCFETNRGAGCASCNLAVEVRSSMFNTLLRSYFAYSSCHKCPATWGLVLQCFIPATRPADEMNRLSLAAPIFVAQRGQKIQEDLRRMIQGLQMHSAISKIMINTSAAREDLGNLVYLATWTEMLLLGIVNFEQRVWGMWTAPCLMSWMFCRLPIATEVRVPTGVGWCAGRHAFVGVGVGSMVVLIWSNSAEQWSLCRAACNMTR